jgi:C-terminal processing protease CtpA/Prc
MPDSVRTYITSAISAYREMSVHRDRVDWDSLQQSVMRNAQSAQSPSETWGALTSAFRGVDRHSFVIPSPAAMAMGGFTAGRASRAAGPAPAALGRVVNGRIGLVAVLSHGGRNRPGYVDSLHAQLQSLDSAGVCGWIVDLRRNDGGNMWPMLAGIGALVGREDVGSFTGSPDGHAWRYRDGQAWLGGPSVPSDPPGRGTRVGGPALKHAVAPVALLLGNETKSSGEMIAIAFMGRSNLRSFGENTGGYASANTNVTLRDGAQLVVTSAYPLDRLGRSYALELKPDERVATSTAGDTDAHLDAAAAWILRQPYCRERPH